MRRKTKKEAQKIHFIQRCAQRIGVLLDDKEIVRKIQNNELDFIRRDSHRVTIWRLNFMEKNYKVVYDKLRKQIITIYEELI